MENEIDKIEINPLVLISTAIEKRLDVDKLTKLFDLQERWEKRQAEKDYFLAFANFQKVCPIIKKTKKVNFTLATGETVNYFYAPLSDISEQIKKPLHDNNLSYRWQFEEVGSLTTCICVVTHAGGHSEKSKMSGCKDDSGKKNQIQQIASTHTYLQRYTLIGALGLSSADEDIDGRGSEEVLVTKKVLPREEQVIILNKWKAVFDKIKTPEKIKSKSSDLLKKAQKENCPMEELKAYVHVICLKLQKKLNEKKPIELNLP